MKGGEGVAKEKAGSRLLRAGCTVWESEQCPAEQGGHWWSSSNRVSSALEKMDWGEANLETGRPFKW